MESMKQFGANGYEWTHAEPSDAEARAEVMEKGLARPFGSIEVYHKAIEDPRYHESARFRALVDLSYVAFLEEQGNDVAESTHGGLGIRFAPDGPSLYAGGNDDGGEDDGPKVIQRGSVTEIHPR